LNRPIHIAARSLGVGDFEAVVNTNKADLCTLSNHILGLKVIDFIGSRIGLPIAQQTQIRYKLPADFGDENFTQVKHINN
jgi:hypothetical protein